MRYILDVRFLVFVYEFCGMVFVGRVEGVVFMWGQGDVCFLDVQLIKSDIKWDRKVFFFFL